MRKFICFISIILSIVAQVFSTSCYCNIKAAGIGMQCEGLHVGSDCRCSFCPGYPFNADIIQNVGCDIKIDQNCISITGTNCPGGVTNQCSITYLRKQLLFLEKEHDLHLNNNEQIFSKKTNIEFLESNAAEKDSVFRSELPPSMRHVDEHQNIFRHQSFAETRKCFSDCAKIPDWSPYKVVCLQECIEWCKTHQC